MTPRRTYRSLYTPANRRTVAGPDHALHYVFDAEGGDSIWAPYLPGVLALALQVDRELLSTEELVLLLAEGVSERPDGPFTGNTNGRSSPSPK